MNPQQRQNDVQFANLRQFDGGKLTEVKVETTKPSSGETLAFVADNAHGHIRKVESDGAIRLLAIGEAQHITAVVKSLSSGL